MRFEDSSTSGDPDRHPNGTNGHANGNGNGQSDENGIGRVPERLVPADPTPGIVTVLLILEDEANRRATRAALQGLPGVEIVGERAELRDHTRSSLRKRVRRALRDARDGKI